MEGFGGWRWLLAGRLERDRLQPTVGRWRPLARPFLLWIGAWVLLRMGTIARDEPG